jgi:hypothetical protein
MYKIQKARKDYICDLCNKKIPKGEKYWKFIIKDEYNYIVENIKEHTNCISEKNTRYLS